MAMIGSSPHYVEWMLHGLSVKSSTCILGGCLVEFIPFQIFNLLLCAPAFVLRHIFCHTFGSVVPACSLCFVLIYVNFLCAIAHHITDTSPSRTTHHIATVPKDHTFVATEIRRKTCERRQSPGGQKTNV